MELQYLYFHYNEWRQCNSIAIQYITETLKNKSLQYKLNPNYMPYKQELNKLHEYAMVLVEEGMFLDRKGNTEEAKIKHAEAYTAELKVHEALKDGGIELEPTRSTICQSAMYCAKNAGLLTEAKDLANQLINYNVYQEYTDNANELLIELR
jgi:hypothetical protein